ncbi:hypothetical protein [Ilumatobacter sp.]|uniref:hypothetical protein n=1 Tax=Ilumatobacter sp. TaxID=1967498 RepID=UPI003C6ABEBB
MSRFQPLVLGLVAAAMVGGIAVGSPLFITLLLPVVGVGLAWSRWGGGRALADGRWTPSSIHVGSPAPTAPTLQATRVTAAPGEIVRALGVVEGRQLVRSGWFGAGLGLCAMTIVLFVAVWGSENSDPWQVGVQYSAWFVHPLTGFVVIAAHQATTRSSRDHTDELFDTCATSSETRTAGMLASAWAPAATAVLFVAVMLAGTAWRSPLVHGSIDLDGLADVLAALALPFGGVALGVALGRWVPFSLAPIVVVVAIGFATVALNEAGSPDWNPYIELSTAPTIENSTPVFTDRAAWWHLVWIIGLIGLASVVALARSRRDRRVFIAGVIAVVVVTAAGVAATRPMSAASADRIADRVARPEDHQLCRDVDGQVSVCMFALHAELLDAIADRVEPVAAALPASVGPVTVRQVHGDDLAQLPPEVRHRLTTAELTRPTNEVSLSSLRDLLDSPRALALHAVGLPTSADAQGLPRVVAGQARGVVALWLATRGLDTRSAIDATTSEDPSSADAFERGRPAVDGCSVPSVTWSAQDLQAARALIALPETEVESAIQSDWNRWIDPATGTDELLAAMGLGLVGPFDRVVAQPGSTC